MEYLKIVWEYIPGPWWVKLVIISSVFDIIIGALPQRIAKYPGALHGVLKEVYRTGVKIAETINAARKPK